MDFKSPRVRQLTVNNFHIYQLGGTSEMSLIAIRKKAYREKVRMGFDFGSLLCRAGDKPNNPLGVYLTVGAFLSTTGETICVKHGWVGTEPKSDCPSRAPGLGRLKMANLREARSLLNYGQELILSPQENWLNPQGYMGGAMGIVRKDNVLLSVSCSGWAEECDLQFALMVLYSMTHQMKLHHVGWSYASEEAMVLAAVTSEEKWDVKGVSLPTDDQARIFLRTGMRVGGNLHVYHEEHQYSPNIPPRVHWDVQVDDPEDFLQWMMNALQSKATIELWPQSDTDPSGRLITPNRDGREHGVFARSNNWNPSAA